MLMRSVLTFVLAMTLGGCSATMSRTQLERVAKDWCLVIRASQAIPVYPLTEDLQPGDVFLVTTPVHQQERVYGEKGFLPLDQLVTRLETCSAYQEFYKGAYFKGDYAKVPHARPRANGGVAQAEDEACDQQPKKNEPVDEQPTTSSSDPGGGIVATGIGTAQPNDTENPDGQGSADAEQPRGSTIWTSRFDLAPVPASAFPTYTFSVQAGSGARLAIPVQGVPVGLGLMNTNRATGSVVLRDAFTYALPGDVLLDRLAGWLRDDPRVRRELARLKGSVGDQPIFLRVVNRVYLLGGVDVGLVNQSATSGGIDVGAPQNTNIMTASTADLQRFKTNAELYADAMKAINTSLGDVRRDPSGNLLPGGSVRFAFASRRAVQLKEDFDRLLAIGYLGFDVEILEGGVLGPPVSTLYRLEGRTVAVSTELPPGVGATSLNAYVAIYASLEALANAGDLEAAHQRDRLNKLAGSLPGTYGVDLYHSGPDTPGLEEFQLQASRSAGDRVGDDQGFRSVTTYLFDLEFSMEGLERAIAAPTAALPNGERVSDEILREKLRRTRALRDEFISLLAESPDRVIADAVAYWESQVTGSR